MVHHVISAVKAARSLGRSRAYRRKSVCHRLRSYVAYAPQTT